MKSVTPLFAAALSALVLTFAACGGGGGTYAGDSPSSPGQGQTGASSGATSSGSVDAFGSIFVNGHEFATGNARIIDDDSGTTLDSSALEVGMNVDVKASSNSSDSRPDAAEVRMRPLARGAVDGSDLIAGSLTVMGQAVQITASTIFSDRRACVADTTSPCSAITGQSGIAVTSGSGSSALPGSYIGVHGYLFSSDSASGAANIVATLISVVDAPAQTVKGAYKAEGVITAASGSSVTIGGLTIDLSAATCATRAGVVPCAGAYGVGSVVSTWSSSAPSLPASSFAASSALLRDKLPVQTPGATIELAGKVSSVSTVSSSFVIRGVTINATGLSSSLPALGDVVKVAGSVASDGQSVTAGSVKLLHAARVTTFAFEGDAAGVSAGTSANTYLLTMLGQTIAVDATARLADCTLRGCGKGASNPFNINTFQTYLAASSSKHLLVRAAADANGNLNALSVTIVLASTSAGISGIIDATPVPVNGSSSDSTTFSIRGLSVSADPRSVVNVSSGRDRHGFGGMAFSPPGNGTVAAGDRVLVRGTYSDGTLTVGSTSGNPPPALRTNVVLNYGKGGVGSDHDGF